MGKKSREKRRLAEAAARAAQQSQNTAPTVPQSQDHAKAISEAHTEAIRVATPADHGSLSQDPPPAFADSAKLWVVVREARDLFRAAAKRAEDAATKADDQRRKFEAEIEKVGSQRQEMDERDRGSSERVAELNRREAELIAKESALTEREARILSREANAEAGFVSERRMMLASTERALSELRQELEKTTCEIARERAAWHDERRRERKQLAEQSQKVLGDAEQGLRERESELDRKGRELDRRERRVKEDEEELNEIKANLDARVEQRVARMQEKFDGEKRGLEARLDQAQKDREAKDALLRQREDADRRFGQRSPEQVLAEISALQGREQELTRLLAERPDADAASRLAVLEKAQSDWQTDRVDLLRQVSELKGRLARATISAVEIETLRDEKAALQSGRDALNGALVALRTEVETLQGRAAAATPFPACTALDNDPKIQRPIPMLDDIADLEKFVEDLQHRIAFDPEHPDRKLYYSLSDLRAFVGGLAMSPLMLLEGISGTGKTSLPVAFARAVGSVATVVEVQAGWRDPQDLCGHYNAFEKRFYESEFLKALYRAQTPRWKDAIHVVLLDEMNLSHPEQYFSDLLSQLERSPEERRLTLMSHAIDGAPSLFLDGSKLAIPQNVWFIGTANHDETTTEFADKTYDRAHVMKFPNVPEQFDVRPYRPRPPVSFGAFQEAFDAAKKEHADEADKAIKFLRRTMRAPLADWFGIGWGARLERQVQAYVPVVVASGGTIGEATDHVLAMRLLRKLRTKHDNRPEHLEKLKKTIESEWRGLDRDVMPKRCSETLDSELRRVGRTPEKDV